MIDAELRDHLEIQRVLYLYGRAIDTREFELLSKVFTPDAVIHYDVVRGTKLEFPKMVEWLRQALQIFSATQHVMSNALIDIDGDNARATTYLTASHVQVKLDGEEAFTLQGGTYLDRLVRTPDGWRIAERTLRSLFVHGEFLGPDQVRLFAEPAPR